VTEPNPESHSCCQEWD